MSRRTLRNVCRYAGGILLGWFAAVALGAPVSMSDWRWWVAMLSFLIGLNLWLAGTLEIDGQGKSC